MDKMPRIIYIFLIFAVFNSALVDSVTDVCIEQTPCQCKISDDQIVDISDLVGSNHLELHSGNLTYLFNGCINRKITYKPPDGTVVLSNDCQEAAALCVVNQLDSKNITIKKLGASKDIKYHTSEKHSPALEIDYYDGSNIAAKVTLFCSPDITSALLEPDVDIADTGFVVISSHACKKLVDHGLSTGSTFLVILFVVLVVYFGMGACVLHFLRGARGMEMIPNIEFWRGLPSLVRDGFLYLLNGCNPSVVPNAETYDRI